MRFEYIETNGVILHTAIFGDEAGELVILLHGFPEYWRAWEPQARVLADAGYLVVVPDQRGYNLSEKPRKVRDYKLSELVGDVVGLADYFGRDRFVLAGHDWGAAVAWGVALLHPGRVERLVIVNVPHPVAMARHLKHSWRQKMRSWYIVAFQLPWFPEFFARLFRFRVFTRTLLRSSLPGTFTEEMMEEYRKTWSEKRALQSMIAWYRAAFRHPQRFQDVEVRVPVLIIWGDRDRFLGKEMADTSLEFCPEGEVVHIEDATHWVLHERREETGELLLKFFKGQWRRRSQ